MEVRIKRAYETPARSDGRRILVDRLWPRGLTQAAARIDFWARAIAPSNALRRWYGHAPDRWPEFRTRYFAELDGNPKGVNELLGELGGPTITLVYSSKEERLNNAEALLEYLESRAPRATRGRG
ncbi:MAG TPA: DUF488 family protein [Planctomycetota bacterium]|nr:DUF488 family protein [Planctomycetota bacterium]